MDTSTRYDSSAGELSSPPSGSLSEPGTPSRRTAAAKIKKMGADEIVVSDDQRPKNPETPHIERIQTVEGSAGAPDKKYGLVEGEWVQLTAAGVPRKKPGRKPGTVVKPKAEGSEHEAKARKPRKPRDPNAPPIQRKRKIAPADAGAENSGPSTKVFALGAPNENSPPTKPILGAAGSPTQSPSQSPSQIHSNGQKQQTLEHRYSPNVLKRESYAPSSMQNILNADPPPRPQSTGNATSMPVRSSSQSYDPIRDRKYDPIRETFSNTGSPRAQNQAANRSPSIASLIEPQPALESPSQNHNGFQPSHSKLQTSSSVPASPSQPSKLTTSVTPSSQPSAEETKEKEKSPAPPPPPKPVIKESNFATIANGPVKKVSPKQKPATGTSTPKIDTLDDMGQEGEGRSILDFGRAKPGEEAQAPTIVLNIPINSGETNKYVNFMRLAEDRYGWDALHPRLAANRDRKARIAAAAASLEKVESGRESGDDMSVDLSDNENEASNPENGVTSGVDAQAKPKKKRNFKEDNYDVDDEFVDDSELMWEAQAAASRDGFFVYSGPLVPEVEKPTGYVLVLSSCSMNLLANPSPIDPKVHPNVGEEVEVGEAAVVLLREALELAAVVVQARAAAPLPGSPELQSQKSSNASARRRSAKQWRSSTRLRLPVTPFSRPPRLLLSPSWVRNTFELLLLLHRNSAFRMRVSVLIQLCSPPFFDFSFRIHAGGASKGTYLHRWTGGYDGLAS